MHFLIMSRKMVKSWCQEGRCLFSNMARFKILISHLFFFYFGRGRVAGAWGVVGGEEGKPTYPQDNSKECFLENQ